ncbi:MAG: PepSY-associated TM helix domain-containing protein [Pseudomonadota bacterium]
MNIPSEFRQSMNWLHTWIGVAISCLLFLIFWTGTISVFDREIDQWMVPEKRIISESENNLDQMVLPYLQASEILAPASVFITLSDERNPAIRVQIRGEQNETVYFDPNSGQPLELTDSLGGTGFFMPFHYSFHLNWLRIGIWIVGFVTLGMLVLIVSGVFIHRKIFQDFFTFRSTAKVRRASLDMHNLSGVLGLPFNFLIGLSGVAIFGQIYFGWAGHTVYGGDELAERQDQGFYFRPAGEQPGSLLASLDDFIVTSEANWNINADEASKIDADRLNIMHYGDVNSYVSVQSLFPSRRVGLAQAVVDYDASSGAVLNTSVRPPIRSGFLWIAGFHFVQFDHWPLRWLYFGAGLGGCVMIASGLVFWMKARVRRGDVEPKYVRVFRALAVASITGIIIASGAFLIANRLLSREASFLSYDRSDLEVWAFLVAWIVSLFHAALRDTKAWRDQAAVIASVAILAVLLNWVTTGDHLIKSIGSGVWSIAGIDLVLIVSAIVAVTSVFRLQKTERIRAQGDKET